MPSTIVTNPRHKSICDRYQAGESQVQIAESQGVSRQRIQYILKKYGLNNDDPVRRMNILSSDRKNFASISKVYLEEIDKRYGIKREKLIYYKYIDETIFIKYKDQLSKASFRGIQWHFNLDTWWEVWEKSGKWDKRGLFMGQYVMARFNDEGPYSPDNVEIITSSANCSEGMLRWHHGIDKTKFNTNRNS